MAHPDHSALLAAIQSSAKKPTHHTFLDNYLGTTHPRYPINNPKMRAIAKNWARMHKVATSKQVAAVLTSLFNGKSFNEKILAGMILDEVKPEQMKFPPKLIDQWLAKLEGWAEVDTLCTGKYSRRMIPSDWLQWKPLLIKIFGKS